MKKGGNKQNLLKGGVPGNKGGSGRPKSEFKEWCKDLYNSPEVRKFVEDLVKGNPIEEKVLDTPGGEPTKILVAAPAKVRMDMIAHLWDRGEGKPHQGIGFEDTEGRPQAVAWLPVATKGEAGKISD